MRCFQSEDAARAFEVPLEQTDISQLADSGFITAVPPDGWALYSSRMTDKLKDTRQTCSYRSTRATCS